MFHRRPRTPSNAHINHDPTPSAATAAAQAFLAHRASSAALSSAAAAAALRSHTTSPVPVAHVQTPRTIRRQGSIDSTGSAGGRLRGSDGKEVRRRSSSGSMTERTFRDPSPNRLNSRGILDAAPPVPALPTELPPRPRTARPPPIPQKSSQRRSSSVDPPVIRVASPPLKMRAGRGMSVDAGQGVSPGLAAAQRASGMDTTYGYGLARSETGGSINFSYPISPRSPTPSTNERGTVPREVWNQQPPAQGARAVASTGTSAPDAATTVRNGSEGALQPAKKKKKKRASVGNVVDQQQPGNGSIGNRTAQSQSLYGSPPPADSKIVAGRGMPSDDSPLRTSAEKKKKKVMSTGEVADRPSSTEFTSSIASYHSDLDTISEDGDNEPERPVKFKTRAGALLVKHPSVVREDRELEERAERADKGLSSQEDVRLSKPASAIAPSTPRGSPSYDKTKKHDRSSSQPSAVYRTPAAGGAGYSNGEPTGKPSPVGRGRATSRGGRPQSLSPTRYAHFATTPPVTSPYVVKHEPPPRALSPAKSAMKHSPSSRSNSVASQASNRGIMGYTQGVTAPSESSMASEDSTIGQVNPRKKGARVSFDEDSVITGEGGSRASSPSYSPYHTTKAAGEMGMPSLEGGKRLHNDDGDGVLKPTPALPAFGSVRVRKNGSPVERTEYSSLPLPLSSDHAVGAVLHEESRRLKEATASPTGTPSRSLETWKTDQTPFTRGSSGESTGTGTESNGGTYLTYGPGQKGHMPSDLDAAADDQATSDAVPGSDHLDAAQFDRAQHDVIPSIELIQPTPNLEQADRDLDWNNSPEAPDGKANHVNDSPHVLPGPSPALAGLAEPEPEEVARNHSPGIPTIGHLAEDLRAQTEHHRSEESDDSGNSVYSDAPEDLPADEGDGFGSIDAVVDSPTTLGFPVTTPPDSPTKRMTEGKPRSGRGNSTANGTETEPSLRDGGDQDQNYRSGAKERQKQELHRATGSPLQTGLEEQLPSKMKKRKKATLMTNQEPQMTSTQVGIVDGKSAPPSTKAKQKQQQGIPQPSNGFITSPISSKARKADPAATMGKPYGNGSGRTSLQVFPTTSGPSNSVYPERGDLKKAQRKSQPGPTAPVGTGDAFSMAVRKEIQNMNAAALPSTQTPAPRKKGVLRRQKSNDSVSSASSSSFKKSRQLPSAGGAVAMRRTMRAGSQPEVRDTGNRSSRFSIRSLSPTGSTSRRAFSPPPSMGHTQQGMMRMSLRGPPGPTTSRTRPASADRPKSSGGFAGFRKTGRKSVAGPKKSRRFSEDSSDDDTAIALPRFSSRFKDSSDEDDGTPVTAGRMQLAPVRGIPRRIGEEDGESSDLPDSSDEESRKPAAGRKAKTPSHEGTGLVSATLRHNGSGIDLRKGTMTGESKGKGKKRRSFFAALGGGGGGQKPSDGGLEGGKFEMAQAMLPVAEGPNNVEDTTTTTNTALIPPSTTDPPLQWPIPAAPSTSRPTTSDGIPPHRKSSAFSWGRHHQQQQQHNNNRPDLGYRRVTLQGGGPDARLQRALADVDDSVVGGGAGDGGSTVIMGGRKKKRFGKLRRVFGLRD